MEQKTQALTTQLQSFRTQLNTENNFEELKQVFTKIISELEEYLNELEAIEHLRLDDLERLWIEKLKYEWSLDAADFSILLRDAYLLFSKSQIRNIIDSLESDYQALRTRNIEIPASIKDTLFQASSELESLLSRPIGKSIESNPPQWFHQKSPVAEIGKQIGELKKQIGDIYNSQEKLCPIIPEFNKYREHLIEHNNFRLIRLRNLETQVQNALELLENVGEKLDKSELTHLSKGMEKLNETIEGIKAIKHEHDVFVSHSGEMSIPIYANGGELYTRTVNLDKNVELWSDTEVLPKMLDADSDIENLFDNAIITLFNTRNKIENLGFTEAETWDFETEIYTNNVRKSLAEVKSYKDSLDKTITELNTHAMNELQLSNIYEKEREFLPELGFINLTKFTGQRIWYETNLWSDWKMKVNQFFHKRKIPFFSNLNADPYAFIQSKQMSEADIENNSLFLKKGYLGKSFYLHRTLEEERLKQAYELWKTGYQGSVLVAGTYGSGKTTFIDYVPLLLPEAQVLRLTLNSSIQLNGRKHQVTNDLAATIDFIGKQSITSPVVVCMDDLERWQNSEHTMYQTVRDLIDGIAKYGKRIFFVVSTNYFMLSHIERMFDFKSRFSEYLEIDKMYQKAIANALVIRHNASLKDYSEDENRNIGKQAARLARKNRYNIGASMLAWERENDKVKRETESVPPSFYQLIEKHQIILRIILANKLLSENVLRQGLTTLDNGFISEELRKLQGYKIVNRTFDNYLQVDPVIVFDVEACLKK